MSNNKYDDVYVLGNSVAEIFEGDKDYTQPVVQTFYGKKYIELDCFITKINEREKIWSFECECLNKDILDYKHQLELKEKELNDSCQHYEYQISELNKEIYRLKQRQKFLEHPYFIKCLDGNDFFIRGKGGYFDEREVVSFNQEKDTQTQNPHWIGFSGNADDNNIQPILRGFMKWCDWLLTQEETKLYINKTTNKKLTHDEIEFLSQLQQDLLRQETSIRYNDCQASPRFWGIEEDDYVYRADSEYGGDEVLYDSPNDTHFDNLQDAKDFYKDYFDEFLQYEEDKEYYKQQFKDIVTLEELHEFLNDNDIYDGTQVVYRETTSKISRNTGAFLTKRDAKEYIERFGYNHNNPRTYAMTGYRNFRLEKLLSIIMTTNWEKLDHE